MHRQQKVQTLDPTTTKTRALGDLNRAKGIPGMGENTASPKKGLRPSTQKELPPLKNKTI